jgi:hypothetical protein
VVGENMARKKQSKKKLPGVRTIQEAMDHADLHFCQFCDLRETCNDKYTHMQLIVTDLSGIEDDEYDYSQPFVNFLCNKAGMFNFHFDWEKFDESEKKMKSKP